MKRPHASIPSQHLGALKTLLAENNFDVVNNLCLLSNQQSHVSSHLLVFNSGSVEFVHLQKAFDTLDFSVCLGLSDNSHASARGNKQANFGFTGQSRNHRCPSTHVPCPSMFLHTMDERSTQKTLDALSTLVVEVHKLAPQFFNPSFRNPTSRSRPVDAFRRVKFAGKISKNNVIEYLAPTLNDRESPLVVAHIDDGNDHGPGNNFAIMASRILVVGGEKPELKRVLQIGTQRKSCADFMKTATGCGTLIDGLVEYTKSIPTRDLDFDPDSYFEVNIGRTCVLEGTEKEKNILVSPSNGDRCVHESIFCSAVDFYIANGDPAGLSQVLEVAVTLLYAPDPLKYTWMVEE